ncbi:unnamed protein product [Umbelopsis sp. WA50703]
MSTDDGDCGPILLSCGSLIIDDIIYQNGTQQKDVLGGAGVFAIYGILSVSAVTEWRNIGYTVQRGHDFVPEIQHELERLDISLNPQDHPDLYTPRGLNTFGNDDHRDFEYIHPVIRIFPRDFPPKWLLSAQIVHLICSAARAQEIVDEWHMLQQKYAVQYKASHVPKTMFMWEPLPWDCLPEKWEEFTRVMKSIDIVSPNHEEAAAVLGTTMVDLIDTLGSEHKALDHLADRFLQAGIGESNQGCIVIRAGKRGALVGRRDTSRWLVPAYWQSQLHSRVRDVTGAGNAFCGGFCVGYLLNKDIIDAALYGSVSASFTVEQVGVPKLHTTEERWNDDPSPEDRLADLRRRISTHMPSSEQQWRSAKKSC